MLHKRVLIGDLVTKEYNQWKNSPWIKLSETTTTLSSQSKLFSWPQVFNVKPYIPYFLKTSASATAISAIKKRLENPLQPGSVKFVRKQIGMNLKWFNDDWVNFAKTLAKMPSD